MLQAEVLSPPAPTTVPPVSMLDSMEIRHSAVVAPRMFEMTFRAVEMDGRNLWREPAEVAIGQLAEAMRLADLRGKPELYINDITPWITVGQADTGQVPIIQDRIMRSLRAACKQIKRDMPVCRLDLRRGEFGIRCYLGRMKPSDHVYEEDMISDSR